METHRAGVTHSLCVCVCVCVCVRTNEGGLEEGLGAAEALVADGDDLSVGQLVALLQGGGGGGGRHLVLKVQRHVAQLLLDVAHDLPLGCTRGGGQ